MNIELATYHRMSTQTVQMALKKRIIVCCDGTWMDSDGTPQDPSNVTRLARLIDPIGRDEHGNPITQVVYYRDGIGTDETSTWLVKKYNNLIGGATGQGIANNIREAYAFICLNYRKGDEIFLVGFSRGAFTARALAYLIESVGCLTDRGLTHLSQIFDDWHRDDPWTNKHFPHRPFSNHCPPIDEKYRARLEREHLSDIDVPIKCVAVWDTVGSLGIPMIMWLPQPPSKQFAFPHAEVPLNVEYAFHALALDERRRQFAPTIWEKPSKPCRLRVLKQCWFPGAHSDVGGAYHDNDMSNIVLYWMISLMDEHHLLTLNKGRLIKGVHRRQDMDANEMAEPEVTWKTRLSDTIEDKFPSLAPRPITTLHRPWGLGKIHDSLTIAFKLGGALNRCPMEYRRPDPSFKKMWTVKWMFLRKFNLIEENDFLGDTFETVHASVRIRMAKPDGLGLEGKGKYIPTAMQGWNIIKSVPTNPDTPIQRNAPGPVGSLKNIVWQKDRPGKMPLQMREEPLGEFEAQMLREIDSQLSDKFYHVRPESREVDGQVRSSTWTSGGGLQHTRQGPKKEFSKGRDHHGNPELHVITRIEEDSEDRPREVMTAVF